MSVSTEQKQWIKATIPALEQVVGGIDHALLQTDVQ